MFYGRATSSSNNIVNAPPNLPVSMYSGTVTWNQSFEGFPSGTLTYTGVLEADLASFDAAYEGVKDGEEIEISLGGIDFIVERYGYTEQPIPANIVNTSVYQVTVILKSRVEQKLAQDIGVFDLVGRRATSISISTLCEGRNLSYSGPYISVAIPEDADDDYTINLSSILTEVARLNGCYIDYRDGISLKSINQGSRWSFPKREIRNHGEIYLAAPPGIKNAIVSNDFTEEDANETAFISEFPQELTLQEPVIETQIDGDEDAHLPPEDSEKLKTVDSNSIDGSGPKRVRRTITTLNGKPTRELIEVYGFKYEGSEIDLTDGSNAIPFWQEIDRLVRVYNYERAAEQRFRITATEDGFGLLRLVVDPDYEDIASVGGLGSEVSFSSRAEYLTSIVGTGWRYNRFRQETNEDLGTVDNEGDPTETLYRFRRIAKKTGVYYDLRMTTETDRENLPFTIDWIQLNELPARIRAIVGFDNLTEEGLVGVITPDIKYVPPVQIYGETNMSSSFMSTINPDFTGDDPDERRYLVSGEESINSYKRTKRDKGYREKIAEYTAQNNFFDVAENIRFRDVTGDLPTADYLTREWEEQERSPLAPSASATVNTTYIANSNYNNAAVDGGRITANGATTVAEAEKVLATNLQIQTIQSSKGSKTVQWYHPNMKPGDYFNCSDEHFSDSWRITDTTITLEYKGTNNLLNRLLVTTEGTQVTLGRHLTRSVSIRTEEETNANTTSPTGDSQEPRLSVRAIGSDIVLSNIPAFGTTRRNF